MTDHEHSHGGHSHAPSNFNRAFAVGIALNFGFVITETVFGILSHSLALLADAGHNMSDVLSLLLAWGASILSTRQPTHRRTYGLRRSSILASLINAVVLLLVIGAIAWEAVGRFSHPGLVVGGTVIWVAFVGILINAGTALLFMSGRKGDLNIRGAFLHMASDAGVSLGVVLVGFAILWTGWRWLDPAVSLAIVLVIFFGTWGLLKDSVNLALDGVPEDIHPPDVHAFLSELPNVAEVHDLHIWGMSTTETALTAHLVMPQGEGKQGDGNTDALLSRICRELHDRFGIAHATLQIEHGDEAHPCRLAPADTV